MGVQVSRLHRMTIQELIEYLTANKEKFGGEAATVYSCLILDEDTFMSDVVEEFKNIAHPLSDEKLAEFIKQNRAKESLDNAINRHGGRKPPAISREEALRRENERPEE